MPASARWCGRCGAATSDERAVAAALAVDRGGATGQHSAVQSAVAPVLPGDVVAIDDEHDAGEQDTGGADGVPGGDDRRGVPDTPTRSWPVRVVVVALLASVAAAAVLLRPGPPGLDEVRPPGWGSADGRDAARTGRLAEEAVLERDDWAPIDQWGFSGMREERWVDVSVVGPAVLVRHADQLTALRRDDGSLIGEFEFTWEAHVVGDLLVVVDFADADRVALVATRIATGEHAWTFETPGRSHNVVSTGDGLLLAADQRGRPALMALGGDGRIRWETGLAAAGWSAYVADVHDGLAVVQAVDDRVFDGDGDPGPQDVAQYVVDVATGAVVELPVDLPSPWEGGSLVLLGDGRAAVSEDGIAREVDLTTGRIGQRLPALDGGQFWGAGEYLAVGEESGVSRLLHRRDLELLWTANGWLDLSPVTSGIEVVAVHQRAVGDWQTSWRDAMTGFHLAEVVMDQAGTRPGVDGAGVVEAFDGLVTARTHDGRPVWTHHLVDGPAESLQAVGDRVVASRGGAHLAVGLDGERLSQTGVRVARSEASDVPWVVVAGGRVVEVRGELLLSDDDLAGVATTWRRDLDATITAVVAGDDVIWAAAGGRIVALDPADGQVVAEAEAGGVTSLSLAGDDALVAVIAGRCVEAGTDCVSRVEMFDPGRQRGVWAVDVPGACGGATLAGDLVAVPTLDGLAFLDRGDGAEVGRWQVERRDCLDAAHHDGRFVLPATGGLVVGDRAGIEASVLVDAPVATAPVVVGDGQVLVGTAEGMAAIDLGRLEVDWTVAVDGGVVAPPLVVDGRLYVLTPDRIARLR